MINHLPSLSVLLPCHNEKDKLPNQLASLLPQLELTDELILADDGSTDGTASVMAEYLALPNVVFDRRPFPSGIMATYNLCAAKATKDWILGASGNDVIKPGAIAAWRKAAAAWPDCRVIFGRVEPVANMPWDIKPRLYQRSDMPDLWRLHLGHKTHGAGAFIRRDAWGDGYTKGGYMADWWQTFKIAARYGCGFIPDIISHLGPAGASSVHEDDDEYNKAIDAILEEINSGECDDIQDQLAVINERCNMLCHRQPMVWFERGSSRGRTGKERNAAKSG